MGHSLFHTLTATVRDVVRRGITAIRSHVLSWIRADDFVGNGRRGRKAGTNVHSGPTFYDEERVFERYRRERRRPDAPNQTLERPTVLRYLGDLQDRSMLDLGCGEAWIGQYALKQGASRYLGLDGSERMLAEARKTLSGTTGEVRFQDLEWWCGGHVGTFDVVVSRLVFHHIRRLAPLFEVVKHHLRPGGLFVFSVEHPIVTSTFDGDIVDGIARAWRVYDYFREGERVDRWQCFRRENGSPLPFEAAVRKQHRTIATYVRELRHCGFQLDRFSEGQPDPEKFQDSSTYERRLDVPLCVVFRCVRKG